MKKTDKLKSINPLIITGVVLRIIYFAVNLIVGGNHIDEAMTGLNAASLADKMTDITGERLPVYFDTWVIGGQSPFATYLSSLFIKLFGYNLFALRLPALIFSVLGFIAFYGFIKEVFKDGLEVKIFTSIACVSPVLLFSGAYLLDCNYLAYMLVFALYFLARAINENKTAFYALSSAFFGLGFYCYIASVLIIPPILAALYLTLIFKKKISLKAVAVSVFSIFIVSLPFILFGLVCLKIIPEFTLFGFSFSDMPNYSRGNSVSFGPDGFVNLIICLLFLVFPESENLGIGVNIFQFSNILGGLLMLFGVIKLAFSVRKNKKAFTFNQKLFALASFSGIFFFCILTVDMRLAYTYRFGVLCFLLLYLEGIGLCEFIKSLKKLDSKKALSVFIALTFIVFNVQFFALYVPQVNNNSEIMYGDPVYKCLDFAQERGADNIAVYEDNRIYMTDITVYLRNYCYPDENRFINIKKEITERSVNKNEIQPTRDGSIVFKKPKGNASLSEDFAIVPTKNLKKINYSKDYKVKDFGNMTVIYK